MVDPQTGAKRKNGVNNANDWEMGGPDPDLRKGKSILINRQTQVPKLPSSLDAHFTEPVVTKRLRAELERGRRRLRLRLWHPGRAGICVRGR